MNIQDIATQRLNWEFYQLSHIKDCGTVSKLVDYFEEQFPNQKQLIKEFRDELCERTFDLYLDEYIGEIIFEQSI
jgi:hypothetical protein